VPLRLPHGPHSLSRAQVAESQQRRILDAMVEAVGENGYAQTPVAAVIARAAVSRKAFYEHFPNKDACFARAAEELTAEVIAHLGATAADGVGASGAEAPIDALFKRALAHPAAVRLVLAELAALRPEGIARREQVTAAGEELVHDLVGLSCTGDAAGLLMRATIGGIGQVLYSRACHRRSTRSTLVAGLLSWMTSYHPIPESVLALDVLAGADKRRVPPGGRAPGTLAPAPRAGRRSSLRGDRTVSPSLVVHSQRERILDAVAILSAAEGYMAVTINGIVVQAAVSADTFYSHFTSKEDAFLVGYEVGHTRGLAFAESACEAAPDWPAGVRAGIAAVLDFLASEPAFAHLALVDAQVAAPHTAARVRRSLDTYARMLATGVERAPHPTTPLTTEAVIGGLFELCLGYVMRGRAHELGSLVPLATYFALAPAIGVEAAAVVATEPD
jgi:AcrR family transcriptional regulator